MTDQQSRIVTRLALKWLPTMQWHRSIYLRRIHPCGNGPDYRKRAIRVTPAGRIVREPVQPTWRRLVALVALIVACCLSAPAHAAGERIVVTPSGKRVLVVPYKNLRLGVGPVRLPQGVDAYWIEGLPKRATQPAKPDHWRTWRRSYVEQNYGR